MRNAYGLLRSPVLPSFLGALRFRMKPVESTASPTQRFVAPVDPGRDYRSFRANCGLVFK